MDDIEDADASIIGARPDVDETLVVDRDVTGAPSFETVVFF